MDYALNWANWLLSNVFATRGNLRILALDYGKLSDVTASTSGIGPGFLGACLILAAGASATSQEVPTFGTTVVVPGGFRGVIYPIPSYSRFIPPLEWLRPLGVIYTSSLNVPARYFREGFPGVTGRLEWFAIDYSARFWIEEAGTYRFELTSDDGARLYIDDKLVVNNDGVHSPQTKIGECALSGGIHRIQVPYFQGPGTLVALVLRVAAADQDWRVFSTEEFKPPPDPETWLYMSQELHMSSAISAPGDRMDLEILLDTPRAISSSNWELVFPAELLELEGDGPEPGRAAKDSGKSLTCSRLKPYSFACNLSGGRNTIGNGPIAIFHFRVRTTAEAGTSAVRIQRAGAITGDSKKLTLNNAEGTVTIKSR